MGKGSPAAPPAPDPAATAAAQAAANVETARMQANLNRVNQYTPTGSITYNQIGPDRWESRTTLSPNQQNILAQTEMAQQTYGRAANRQLFAVENALSRPVNEGALPGLVSDLDFSRYGDPNVGRDRVERALLDRMRPQMDATRVGLEARLRNQGLSPGSEAWANALRDLGTQENDATLAAVLGAGQEQNRLQQLGLSDAQFRNQARSQALAETLQLRAQPINEASALLTGQMIQAPQFQQTPQVQVAPTDYLGAVGMNQAAQNTAYQGRVANQQAGNAAAAGAATAAISAAAIIA